MATDSQIIRALRCTSVFNPHPDCTGCPYQRGYSSFMENVLCGCDVDKIAKDAADRLEKLTGEGGSNGI